MTTVKGRKTRIESKERGKRDEESHEVRVERKSHEKSKIDFSPKLQRKMWDCKESKVKEQLSPDD